MTLTGLKKREVKVKEYSSPVFLFVCNISLLRTGPMGHAE